MLGFWGEGSEPWAVPSGLTATMSDDANILHSHPVDEKEPSKRRNEEEDPKQHGGGGADSEAGGEPGEGRTGTGLGSTDS